MTNRTMSKELDRVIGELGTVEYAVDSHVYEVISEQVRVLCRIRDALDECVTPAEPRASSHG